MFTEYLTEGFVPNQVTVHGSSTKEVVEEINQAIPSLGEGYNGFPGFAVPDQDAIDKASNKYVWPSSQRASGTPSDKLLQYYKGHDGKHVVIEIMQKISSSEKWSAKAYTSDGVPEWYKQV